MDKLELAKKHVEKYRVRNDVRPGFHVSPPVGWMNDPNGFSEYQGAVHLFYQYHPYSTAWGPMHWGHYVTRDFIRWSERPVALAPDCIYDAEGCFSGSALVVKNHHYLFYTGVEKKTGAGGKEEIWQHQCLAEGDGKNYQKVKKNPIIPGAMLPTEFSRADFRDPKVWKEGNRYFLLAGNRDAQGLGQLVLFESKNLMDWSYVRVFLAHDKRYGTMWECPDFFPLDKVYVLMFSPQDMPAYRWEFHNGNNSIYFLGEYDAETCTYHKKAAKSFDYGLDFYAPQTTLLADGRRILIAWMQSWDALKCKPKEQAWSGMMTLPRELSVIDGKLLQRPVRELTYYRKNPLRKEKIKIVGWKRIAGLQGRSMDLTITLFSGKYRWFILRFACNKEYGTYFAYDRDRQKLIFDRTDSGVKHDVICRREMKVTERDGVLKLRLILDTYSAEMFVNDGESVFSATVYTPKNADYIWFYADSGAVVDIEKYDIVI